MKARALGFIAVIVTVIALSALATPPPTAAADVITSKSFTGFEFEKSTVTAAMKKQIKAWVEATATASAGYTMVGCVGYTGFNANRREAAFLQSLAEKRSRNICNYIRTLRPIITLESIRGIPGDGKSATARKVTVRLIKPGPTDPPDPTDTETPTPTDTETPNPTDTGGGGGDVVIGQCDNSLNAKMRSRILTGQFYFQAITVSSISSNCYTKVMDIYLLDAAGNQLATATSPAINATSVTLLYTAFSPGSVRSDLIKKVAFEIRSP
jgi:hypothetical protein